MKKIMVTASAFLFSMALTTGALAAGEYGSDHAKEGQQAEQQMGAEQQDSQQFAAQQAGQQQVKSTNKLIGKAVKSSDGQELGNVSDIMVDVESGQVGYALVSSGGVLGMGEDQYIVPWKALQTDPQTEALTLNISQDKLKQAPKGQTVADQEQAREIHQFYGVSPYWEEGGQQEMQQQPTQMEEPMMMEDSMQQEEPQMMEDESKKQME